MNTAVERLPGDLLVYRTKDGLLMNGLLFRERNGNKAVVISVFGMVSDFFSAPRDYALIRELKGCGTDVFLAGNRGIGSVFPFDKNGKTVFLGTAREKFTDCVLDVGAAVNVAFKIGYRKIILMGHSTGCQKSVYYLYRTKDRRVKGLILLGPAGDYDVLRRDLKQKLPQAVRIAKNMIKHGKKDEITPRWVSYYTPQRFLSYAVGTNPEARIFNYDSEMKEFRTVKCPILAVFGEKEQWATKPIKEHIKILKNATNSKSFSAAVVKGGDHSFTGKEKGLAKVVTGWVERNN